MQDNIKTEQTQTPKRRRKKLAFPLPSFLAFDFKGFKFEFSEKPNHSNDANLTEKLLKKYAQPNTIVLFNGVVVFSSLPKGIQASTFLKNKKDLSYNKWIFENINIGNNNLIDMVNYHSIGIATLKDDVFKMDSHDELFCYKNGQKIEKEICKKYIKATKSKYFSDYKYIIYPYINGKIINEDTLIKKYPFCYKYLLSRKNDLLSRDKGNISKYDSWYAYGRKQGLLKERKGDCIILPSTFINSRDINYIEVPENEECLVLSGIFIDIKKGMKDRFIEQIKSDNFYKFCETNNKILSDKKNSNSIWLNLSSKTIKDYSYLK